MKKRFTEEQIIRTLKEVEAGMKMAEECRTHGISDTTYYNWKSKFSGKIMDEWAYTHGVHINLIQPGKPTRNCLVESFNGRFQDEWLNEHWFLSMRQAKDVIENWRNEYDEERPHSSLKNMIPKEFCDRF